MVDKRVMIVVGARPNFMKAAPILAAISNHNDRIRTASGLQGAKAVPVTPIFVHTGQHYDAVMSDAFFEDLNLPRPNIFLGAGSGSHAVQTAEIMKRFEGVLLKERPDVVIVVGDVNSTLACALVTAKISFDENGRRPVIAHVEAGLRSFDRCMPEEINRVATDHLSDLLFVTERSGLRNLEREGIAGERVFFVGNTMIDSVLAFEGQAENSTILDRFGLRSAGNGEQASYTVSPYALLTLHRPANVDNVNTFREIVEGLQELAGRYPVIFPAHPRTRKQIHQYGMEQRFHFAGQVSVAASPVRATGAGITLGDPLGYLDFLCLMKHARVVVTDSGGIQEETTCLGVPCVTVRNNTERPVTVEKGTNILAGTSREGIRGAIRAQLARVAEQAVPELWDGNAANRIVEVVIRQSQQTGVPHEALVAVSQD